eukprot:10843659-Ditylum_brightwellii.AAC.1
MALLIVPSAKVLKACPGNCLQQRAKAKAWSSLIHCLNSNKVSQELISLGRGTILKQLDICDGTK